MILVKDLGMELPNKNSKRTYRYGIYKCDSCLKEFKKRTANVNLKSICVSCSSKLRFSKHLCKNENLYSVWVGIKQRCFNERNKSYKHYGARGITICNEWVNNYLTFRKWSIENGYKQGLSIDRIDVNGNYEPSNCRWTTSSIQMQNTRLLHITNTSGYRGVFISKKSNKFRVTIQINKKRKHLGYFENAIDGAKAYNQYVLDNNLEHTLNEI